MMKPMIQLVAAASATIVFATSAIAAPAASQAPDVLVKQVSMEVIDSVKGDKDIQGGSRAKIVSLVNAKILPHVDMQRMTAMAAGRHWRTATPEQKQKLSAEFKDLLVYTYAGALSTIKNETVDFKPLRLAPEDTEAEVRSQVNVARGEPITLNYRLIKTANGWKIYDMNVMGAWLVETYRSTFTNEISKGGFDGLIKRLAERNAQLAAKAPK